LSLVKISDTLPYSIKKDVFFSYCTITTW